MVASKCLWQVNVCAYSIGLKKMYVPICIDCKKFMLCLESNPSPDPTQSWNYGGPRDEFDKVRIL